MVRFGFDLYSGRPIRSPIERIKVERRRRGLYKGSHLFTPLS